MLQSESKRRVQASQNRRRARVRRLRYSQRLRDLECTRWEERRSIVKKFVRCNTLGAIQARSQVYECFASDQSVPVQISAQRQRDRANHVAQQRLAKLETLDAAKLASTAQDPASLQAAISQALECSGSAAVPQLETIRLHAKLCDGAQRSSCAVHPSSTSLISAANEHYLHNAFIPQGLRSTSSASHRRQDVQAIHIVTL